LIIKLDSYQLLSQKDFEEAYASIKLKLPPVASCTVKVLSKEQTNNSRKALVFKDKKTIYLQNSKSTENKLVGAFGEVKLGYEDLISMQPKYAIKKPYQNNIILQGGGYKAPPEKQCKREVQYGRLLERNTLYFFHKGRPRSVTNWLNGILLEKLSVNQAQKASIAIRLKWLISALTDLN
jgi:hypothetical protein